MTHDQHETKDDYHLFDVNNMFCTITIPALSYSQEYFYGLSLMVSAVVNFVLAGMLLFDSNNYLYTETPRYLRSRRLTGMALAVFGMGFLLHWFFMPHFTNLLASKALSFTYFHIGGVLFSMSHTGLIDRHYFCRKVVVRDVSLLLVSLVVYWVNAWIANQTLTYIGSALFFVHVGYLTVVFYNRFYRIYQQLGNYAEYKPNDTDKEVLWLHFSCHLIILFGIGGMLCTVVFRDDTLPFTLLLFAGVVVFTYIYKALDSFGTIAGEAESNLKMSEEYLMTAEGQQEMKKYKHHPVEDTGEPAGVVSEVDERIERWVADRHFANDRVTLNDALRQMDITTSMLNAYLDRHNMGRGFRRWLSYLRVEESKRLMLEHPGYSLDTIAKACGYVNNSSLSRSFKMMVGVSPIEWINENRGK